MADEYAYGGDGKCSTSPAAQSGCLRSALGYMLVIPQKRIREMIWQQVIQLSDGGNVVMASGDKQRIRF